MSTSTEVANPNRIFDDSQLAAIDSFEAAVALANAYAESVGGVVVESASDYGTGFKVVEDKASLVGVDLLILQWNFHEGDYGTDPFVAAEAVTKNGDKVVIVDGGTGIRAQLQQVTATRVAKNAPNAQALLKVEGGLTRSDYWRNTDTGDKANRVPDGAKKGEWEPATTYYLSA